MRIHGASLCRYVPHAEVAGPAFALMALVWVVYAPSLPGGYLWDDQAITQNRLVAMPEGWARIWFSSSQMREHETHYWPLVYSSFWLEYRLWGLWPQGSRAANLVLFTVTVVWLWRLAARGFLPAASGGGGATVRSMSGAAWLAAALFAVHPVHVESVAWIIQRKDMLSGLLFVASFWFFVRHSENPSARRYAVSLVCFGAAMLSKTSVVFLPAALAVWLWWQNGRLRWRDGIALAPFAGVALALSLWDVLLSRALQANPYESGLSVLQRFVLSGRAVWFYLGRLVWPDPLLTIYPKWEIAVAPAAFLYPSGVALLLVALAALTPKLGRGPLACLLYYIAALSPILGWISHPFMSHSYVADRFQYLASAGPIMLLAAGWGRIAGRRGGPRWLAPAGAAALLAALSALTWRQSALYRDDNRLFAHTIRHNPDSWLAHNGRGVDLLNAGQTDAAIESLEQAIRLHPDFAMAHNNLGVALMQKSQFHQAIEHFFRALELRNDYYEAYNNLGAAFLQTGLPELAAAQLRRSLKINPTQPETLNNLAWLLATSADPRIRHPEQAVQLARQACDLSGHKDFGFCATLAVAYAAAGLSSEAEAMRQRARELARAAGREKELDGLEGRMRQSHPGRAED